MLYECCSCKKHSKWRNSVIYAARNFRFSMVIKWFNTHKYRSTNSPDALATFLSEQGQLFEVLMGSKIFLLIYLSETLILNFRILVMRILSPHSISLETPAPLCYTGFSDNVINIKILLCLMLQMWSRFSRCRLSFLFVESLAVNGVSILYL